jgi:hypothetical protein
VTAFASDCILGLALDVVGPVFSGSPQSGEPGIQSITDRSVQNGKDVCSALERKNRGIGCIAKLFSADSQRHFMTLHDISNIFHLFN